MLRNFNFALTWYLTVICTFFFSIFLLLNLTFSHKVITQIPTRYQLYKALPSNITSTPGQEVSITTGDARDLIVAKFFRGYKSPLENYAVDFIKSADEYKIDYRLLPSIAMQESNGGKKLPAGSNNPFGYGIYGGKIMKFNSFKEAIERVSLGLRQDYLDQGLKTPEEIMTKYTPPSLAKGGAWAIGVSAFMEQLR